MSDKRPRWTDDELRQEEEHILPRKESRQDRKRAMAKDRSKYKKTDQKKLAAAADQQKNMKLDYENLLRGRVLTIVPQGILVEHEGEEYTCTLRGLLKKDKTQSKNLVTVGDLVLFEKVTGNEGIIANVEPRKSVLSRADNLDRRKNQMIAANVDQVLITTSVVNPPLKTSILDRYIIAAHMGGLEPIIVINKIDLLKSEDPEIVLQKEMYDEALKAYAHAGVRVISISAETGEGMENLKEAMKDKVSVFSGQSGVGKTSLINELTGLDLRIGKTVDRTKKGSHTTSYSQLIPLEFGGWCVDTPGIRSFGVWDLDRKDIDDYFDEIQEASHECKYPDCTHTQEQGCAVMAAVEAGKISPLRYESYLMLVDSISQEHHRR